MARVRLQATAEGALVLDVVLSERNLLTLLSKLYTPGSSREFVNGDVPAGIALARFRAERDDQHYNSPSRRGAGPGEMHPITEKVLAAIREALAQLADESPPGRHADGSGSE
jgi:hypothetical protein